MANLVPPPCPSTTCRPASLIFNDPGWTCEATNASPTTSCDTDGDVCNGVDMCDGAGNCAPGAPPNLDDGNPATLDYCGPDGVKHVPISSNGTAKEAFATPTTGPDPRSRSLPVAPNAGGPVVDESRGTLNYRYSFELPAARGRYQPHLDLTYSSATTYNDSVGAGWSLTSFYIEADTATPPTSVSDTAPLQYWLVSDGARVKLLKTPSTTDQYRTQVQGPFVAITFPGDNCWSATDAAGTNYYFCLRRPWPVLSGLGGRWYLNHVMDVDGNKTSFTYEDETGASALLTKIEYNRFAAGVEVGTSVELAWSPDYQRRVQRAGDTVASRQKILRTVRIKGASTSGSPTLLRHELTYSHQKQADTLLVSQVQVFAGETTTSLPPTSFQYQTGTTDYALAPGVGLDLPGYLTLLRH